MRFVDDFLNQITMYRLTLYYLIFLVLAATALSFFGLLPFSSLSILISAIFLVSICVISNKILAAIFKAPTNIESSYITALILCLIITPASKPNDFAFLFIAGVIAMVGKYVLFFERKHIFNPAAAAVVTTSILFGWNASWWVGTIYMLPALLLGILIVKKIKRFGMITTFLAASSVTMLAFSLTRGNDLVITFSNTLTESPIIFFTFIMLTEPLTSPTGRFTKAIYGILVGVLYSFQVTIGSYYITPEIALLCGNLFAYIIGMKERLKLTIKEKINIAKNTFEFVFNRPANFSFSPGQYLEWTLPHKGADSRGVRRFFTIASSPTESVMRIGVRLGEKGSSFKRALLELSSGGTISAGQLSGDFILPKSPDKKLVFIAGGIGITPFRSMIKYLIDKNEKRDIALFYANSTPDQIVYKDIFDTAEKTLGIKTIYLAERLTTYNIQQSVPDFSERTFYLSGPHSMVDGYLIILEEMGIGPNRIITDYFPGY